MVPLARCSVLMFGGWDAVGIHSFTSLSRPLVANNGKWGCGSSTFTWARSPSHHHPIMYRKLQQKYYHTPLTQPTRQHMHDMTTDWLTNSVTRNCLVHNLNFLNWSVSSVCTESIVFSHRPHNAYCKAHIQLKSMNNYGCMRNTSMCLFHNNYMKRLESTYFIYTDLSSILTMLVIKSNSMSWWYQNLSKLALNRWTIQL